MRLINTKKIKALKATITERDVTIQKLLGKINELEATVAHHQAIKVFAKNNTICVNSRKKEDIIKNEIGYVAPGKNYKSKAEDCCVKCRCFGEKDIVAVCHKTYICTKHGNIRVGKFGICRAFEKQLEKRIIL